ncbi:MAG: cyclic nucleotide-binding protein [Desulfobacteraceae bacterium]|nr:MAG: cyclic nucleotide-binding protein [Desulfobacteraceae bacterium]
MLTIGRYDILTKIGEGATGVVYLAWDPVIQRKVALKVSKASSPEFVEDFLHEAKLAGQLNHPNIVSVYDAGAEGDYCYIAMEFINGSTLACHCDKQNLLPPDRSLEIALDICKGLDYAHRRGVIHQDIKPSNILIDEEGSAKIADFGIARMAGKEVMEGIWGSPHYISPEQISGKMVSPRSDIFSLGCVLYELLAGEQSFPGEDLLVAFFNATNTEPAPLSGIRGELPVVLEEIICKALKKAPEERYQNSMEMAYDLTVALRSIGRAPRRLESIADVIGYMQNLSFFLEFRKEQLQELTSIVTVVIVTEGRLIAVEGEIDDTIYIILSGEAKVMKSGVEIATIGAGECFGEMALLGGKPRSANVSAKTDCILMKINANLLEQFPESIALLFYKNFAKTLLRRLSPAVGKTRPKNKPR